MVPARTDKAAPYAANNNFKFDRRSSTSAIRTKNSSLLVSS